MKSSNQFPNLTICNHPLIQHKLTHMRDVTTSTKNFRQLLREISLMMGFEITRNLPLTQKSIDTPLIRMDSPVIDGKKLAIVPILRAGLGMLDGLLDLVPSARSGHIGVYRNDDKEAVEYFVKLPSIDDRTFILCDPMLATGHTVKHALSVLVDRGVKVDRILLLTLLAAPEGLHHVYSFYPNLKIYTASLDDYLDENAYIVPGLGDAGDRLFGTHLK